MFERNEVDHDDLISIIFTATDDIRSHVPGHRGPHVRPGRRAAALRPGARRRGRHPAVHPGAGAPRDRAGPARAAPRLPRGSRQPPRRPARLSDVLAARPHACRSSAPGSSAARSGWPCAGRLARHRHRPRPGERRRRPSSCGALDAVGEDPASDLTVVATPVGAVADEARRRSTPATGVVTDVGSVKAPIVAAVDRPAVRRRPPDGRLRAGGRRRRRRRPVRGGGLGADPDRRHRRRRLRHRALRLVRPSAPRWWPCRPTATTPWWPWCPTCPHLTAADAHGPGRRAGRGAPGPAAPGRRRLPGHDPDRRRAPRHLARHLRREPRGHRRASSTSSSTRWARSATSWPTATATGLLDLLEQARAARRQPARPGSAGPTSWPRCGSPCPTGPASLAEVTTLATELGVNIVDLEIAHSSEGDRGVLILLVEAGAGRAACTRPWSTAATAARHQQVLGRSWRSSTVEPIGPARAAACGCRATSRSPTGPSSWPPWPRAVRRSRGLSDGDDVAGTRRALEALGAVDRRRGRTASWSVGGALHESAGVIDVGNSGTSIRLLAGLCAAFAVRSPCSPATSRSPGGPWTGWPSPCG